ANPAHRAWFAADAARRECLILRDLGVLAHYVGDGSQPLHVSIHFNGWGPGPNPDGFTQDRIHAFFEGAFVHDYIDPAAVAADMAPAHDCQCTIEQRARAFLAATNAEVVPLYRLQKAGAFVGATKEGRAFVAERLAAGADELRDEVIEAWRASAGGSVGYPEVKVRDILAGRVDPYDALYGLD
ncbi:MAG: S1/P1 Nuclease, partial [Caulobacteraceae bacterium]